MDEEEESIASKYYSDEEDKMKSLNSIIGNDSNT
jgi:hypothetical protein